MSMAAIVKASAADMPAHVAEVTRNVMRAEVLDGDTLWLFGDGSAMIVPQGGDFTTAVLHDTPYGLRCARDLAPDETAKWWGPSPR